MRTQPQHRPRTLAVHAGEEPDPTSGALVPPLILANTFHLGSAAEGARRFAGDEPGYVYSRWGNPTVAVLEARVAALEGAEAAVAAASGMAAITSALLTAAQAGDHIVAAKAIYPSSYHLLDDPLARLGLTTTFVDATDSGQIAAALRPNTRVIYLETPGNPLLALCDLAAIARIAREHAGSGGEPDGARPILTICDSTFATPINQNPLALGIDVVVHSATKYLSGHGDAIGGVIAGRSAFIAEARDHTVRYHGGVLAPFNAYLIQRGIHTLPLRMAAHNDNALAVATYLESHPAIASVSYPGLASHPQHALAKRQMRGYGGMISFELKGGVSAGARLMDRVQLCALATSLGDTRTLISHPASTTHHVLSREDRLKQGVSDGLVRLSVGIEDVADILDDLDEALRGD